MSHPHPFQLTLSKADEGMELTHEEFANAHELEPWQFERVKGKLVVMSPCDWGYQIAKGEILTALVGYYFVTHVGIAERIFSRSWMIIDELTERVADIAVYFPECNVSQTFPRCVPTIVYEVVTPFEGSWRRNYVEKRAEYAKIGVWEYVIVDPVERRVVVLQLQDGQYTETELGQNDFYTTPLLPGLEIPLADIFPESDS